MTFRFLPLLLLLASGLPAQHVRLPAAEEVLDRVEQGMKDIQDYTVQLEGEVNMEGVRVPKAVIRMYFKRPNKVHFESGSFSMIPRDGIVPDVTMLRQKFDARTVDLIDTAGRKWYKLQLAAKEAETRLRQIYAYVDAGEWTLRRVETTPYEGRLVSFEFEYQYVDGRYLLPAVMTATFGSIGTASDEAAGIPSDSPASQFREMQRMMRNGSVRFTYNDYNVNTGLPDSLFTSGR